jgi:hypothetical protein
VVLATKFGLVSHSAGGPGVFDSSPANVRAAVEGSLRRLGFDVRTGKREKQAWLLGSVIGGDCVKRYDAVVENGRIFVEL